METFTACAGGCIASGCLAGIAVTKALMPKKNEYEIFIFSIRDGNAIMEKEDVANGELE